MLDNFFELGGNSIQGAVVINRLQEKIGHHISVIALFDSPTIAGLAHYMGEACPTSSAASSVPNRCRPSKQEGRPLDPPAEWCAIARSPRNYSWQCSRRVRVRPGSWSIRPAGSSYATRRSLNGWAVSGRFTASARGLHGEPDLPGRLEDMAAEYVAAIRELQPRGPYLLGGWSAGGLVALEMAQQLLARGESIQILALLDTIPESADDPTGPIGPASNMAWISRWKNCHNWGRISSSRSSGSTP